MLCYAMSPMLVACQIVHMIMYLTDAPMSIVNNLFSLSVCRGATRTTKPFFTLNPVAESRIAGRQ